MTPEVTTLPISPQTFWIIAGLTLAVASSALVYWALIQTGREYRPPIWEDLPKRSQGMAIFLGLLWIGLFALTIIAAYLGVWEAIHPKDAASQPGPGLGALLAALLGAPFVIWGTWLKYQTVRFQKEGHMTDRINTAVEQLGAEKTVKVSGKDADGKDITIEETRPNIEVRIGAILSLERIAQDSTIHDKGRDHVRVMEILCAYVRENAPAQSARDSLRQIWERESEAWDDMPERFEEWFCAEHSIHQPDIDEYTGVKASTAWAASLPNPRVEIVQALQVIGRRTVQQRRAEAAWPEVPTEDTIWPFDLPCPRLPDEPGEAALSAEELKAYRERLGDWQGRTRSYKGYRLDLSGANLQGAKLAPQRPDASDAVFSGANLSGARMEGASLKRARMEGANLRGARIEGADLSVSRMEGADLYKARMEGAMLAWARMEGANLYEARMEGASLGRARFDSSTNWAAALPRGAAAQFVDFTTTPISADQVNDLFGDGSSTLADTIPRPKHWPVWELPWDGKHAFGDEWRKWRGDPDSYKPPPPPKGDEGSGAL